MTFCGKGCQPEFGWCGGSFKPNSPVAMDNTCGIVGAGAGAGRTCNPAISNGGQCCSAWGYCVRSPHQDGMYHSDRRREIRPYTALQAARQNMETVTHRSRTFPTRPTALLSKASGTSVPSFPSVTSRFLNIFSFPRAAPRPRGFNVIQLDVAQIMIVKSAQTVNAALPADTA